MKAKELRNMDESSIMEKFRDEKAALNKMKFSHKVAGTENPMTMRKKRREIARMLTILNERNKTR